MSSKAADRMSAQRMAMALLEKQMAEGRPLTPEEREFLAVALAMAKGEPIPCVHCGKNPHE